MVLPEESNGDGRWIIKYVITVDGYIVDVKDVDGPWWEERKAF